VGLDVTMRLTGRMDMVDLCGALLAPHGSA
jgi:hypothetical protein